MKRKIAHSFDALAARALLASECPPQEIRCGRPIAVEQFFGCVSPLPLVVKPDVVWKTADDIIIPIEVKFRRNFMRRFADSLQLSAAALALKGSSVSDVAGLQTADYGYLRIVHQNEAKWMKIPMLSIADITKAWLMSWLLPDIREGRLSRSE